MIVEFAGVSGGGKTTTIAGILENSSSNNIYVSKDANIKKQNYITRNIKKTVRAFSNIINRPGDLKLCKRIFSYAPDIRGFQKLKLITNYLAINNEQNQYQNKNKVIGQIYCDDV